MEQIAADEQKKSAVLTQARTDLISRYRQQLGVAFAEFTSARDSLQTVLADGTVVSDEEAAALRSVLSEFGALFGDPQGQPDPKTFTGNALLRAEMFTGFRLNVMALRALVVQLSKSVDEIVGRTQSQITKVTDAADRALVSASTVSAIGLLATSGWRLGSSSS